MFFGQIKAHLNSPEWGIVGCSAIQQTPRTQPFLGRRSGFSRRPLLNQVQVELQRPCKLSQGSELLANPYQIMYSRLEHAYVYAQSCRWIHFELGPAQIYIL